MIVLRIGTKLLSRFSNTLDSGDSSVVYRSEIPHTYIFISVCIGQKAAFLTGENLMFRGPSAGSYINVTKVFLCLAETAPLHRFFFLSFFVLKLEKFSG